MAEVIDACEPLSPDNFADLEHLFSARGCSFARGCWCMDYRRSGKIRPREGMTAAQTKQAMLRELAADSPAPGLLAYDAERRPIGWVAVGPRAAFARLANSPVMKPVDDLPVWSVVCFVVPAVMRGKGLAHALLAQAIAHAAAHAAPALEGYPIDKAQRSQPQWLWHGTHAMFASAGFEAVARRKPERPVMRLTFA